MKQRVIYFEIHIDQDYGTSYKKSTTKPTNAGSYAVTVDVAVGTQYSFVKSLSLGTFK